MVKFTFFERVVYVDEGEFKGGAGFSIKDDAVTVNGNVIGIGPFKTEYVENTDDIESEVYRGSIR